MNKSIKEIYEEFNTSNGGNHKKAVAESHKDNELLQEVLKYTHDRINYVYGVTMKNVQTPTQHNGWWTLENSFKTLEKLANREITGNAAIELIEITLQHLNKDDAYVFASIINRDPKIGFGTTNINKIWKGLIPKQKYMRCAIGTPSELEKLDWASGVYSQMKMDGTYRQFLNGQFTARSGKTDSFPDLAKSLDIIKDYALTGELTLRGEKDRKKGNGNINSLTPDYENIIFTVWDAIPINEYTQKKGISTYEERFENLKNILKDVSSNNIEIVPCRIIHSPKEAYKHFQELTENGFEGTVLKSKTGLFSDGTSKDQLKVKLEISIDVRITGFTEGNNKRATYFGAIEYQTDDGRIVGRTSGFSDKQMKEIHANRNQYIGKVMEVQCNDITQAKGSDTYSLSHPRFIEMRTDKNTTDDLDRAIKTKEMAMVMK